MLRQASRQHTPVSDYDDRWTVGTIESVDEQDSHCVVTVQPPDSDPVELTVTLSIRDRFIDRLDLDGESPIGEQVWYRKRGG